MSQNRVLYVQYCNPAHYPPLEHSSRILADAGCKVLFLGTEAQGPSKLRFPPHENIKVEHMPAYQAGWRQKLHYVRYALWVFCSALIWRPSWIYASDLPSCPVGLALSIWPGWQVIYHEHDTPDSSLTWDVDTARPASKTSRYQRMMLWARRQLARKARLCIIPSKERVRAFEAEMDNGEKVACVWNCPSRSEVRSTPSAGREPGLTIWYHGSVVPPKLPDTLVRALALVPAFVKLRFAGYETIGYQGYLQHLTELATSLGISDRLEFVGALNREELLSQCQSCDIGLAVFRDNTMMPMIGATNKPFEYLACSLALLVPDVPAWRELFVEPGYGLGCDAESPEGIAAAIQWFVDHPQETRAMGDAGYERILNEWNYEAQFAPIERLMTCPA